MLAHSLHSMFAAAVLVFAIIQTGTGSSPKVPDSQPTKESLTAPVYVAGYSIVTRNSDEMTSTGKIPALWMHFIQNNLAATIPNKSSQSLIVVYSDYATDENGQYTYLLGAPVTSIEHLPAGMTYRTIPAGPYAVFTTDKGPVATVIPAAWKHIWSTSPSQLGGRRTFLTDYEIYDQRSADPNNSQVEIHIGINPSEK